MLLVLALPRSHTTSIEKQHQLVSLIVIRRVFEDLGGFTDLEPWVGQAEAAQAVLLDMGGAVAMFVTVTAFAGLRRLAPESSTPPAELAYSITAKRGVAMMQQSD
ncbi:MAG: hypothetical protein AAGJ46_15545 [Planctomycetota bacterium]